MTLSLVALLVTIVATVGFLWAVAGRGRWRSAVDDRLLYGIPWGTAITIAVIVAFYLLLQDGVRTWSEPLTLPFISWSYLYPTGLLTSGFAHSSPAHLSSNMVATLVFAPIAEYAWGHYPPSRWRSSGRSSAVDRRRNSGGLLARPWLRALVIFPGMLLASALVTAVFSLGPGLGFSGAVFAIIGFAVISQPLSSIVAVAVTGAVQVLFGAVSEPVVVATTDPGPPGPPSWAGVGFQAHMLGFLLGVIVAIGVLWYRRSRPATERVFLATFVVGLAQTLWLIAWPRGDDTFVRYQAVGVIVVCLLTILITVAATGGRPAWWTRRSRSVASSVQSLSSGARVVGIVCLVGLTALVALPSLFVGLTVVGADTVPNSDGVEIEDYTVTYAQNATSGQAFIDLPFEPDDETDANTTAGGQSGVIVVNDQRQLWTVETPDEVLEYDGNSSVTVGGLGWQERLTVERTGWEVLGNESAYAVDIEHDGEQTRVFATDPIAANAAIDGATVAVDATDDGFELQVSREGSTVDETLVPDRNETATAGGLEFERQSAGDTDRLIASATDTEVQIAERETYA